MRCPAAPRAQSLLKIFSVGVGPIRANRILRRPEFEPAGAHQARKLPFEPVLALGIPFRLDRAARLRPKIAVIVRAAKIERDQMVDLKVGVRAGREPVFRENAIVAGSRPMPELPRVAIAADVRRAGRADRAGGKSRVWQHGGELRPARRHLSVRRAEMQCERIRAGIAMNWEPSARQCGGYARKR
jgi:hypothetical protein